MGFCLGKAASLLKCETKKRKKQTAQRNLGGGEGGAAGGTKSQGLGHTISNVLFVHHCN